MSAFIVSEQCMKNIIYNVFWTHKFKESNFLLDRYGYRKAEDFDRMAHQFYNMNRLAVFDRYGRDDDYAAIPNNFNWDTQMDLDKYQALKSMHCLRYQCNEGEVADTATYKFLEALIESWTYFIINGLPEYEQAEWG